MTGAPQNRGVVGYYASVDVLPVELSLRAYEALGTARKVTFGTGGSPLTKTEGMLPEDLVWEIRDHLDKYDLSTRTVFISKYKSREVPRHLAFTLAKFGVRHGCTLTAAADAVGYHSNSLVLWGLRRAARHVNDFDGTPEEIQKYMEAGRAHCATLGTLATRAPNANHYVWVGWMRGWVVPAVESVRGHVKALADAGGHVDVAAAVYQFPSSQLAPWGKWQVSFEPKLPEGPPDVIKEWASIGRAYCVKYNRPLVPRHHAWVGWLLARTSTEMELAPVLGSRELAGD